MLFNSVPFIFYFLPGTLVGFLLLRRFLPSACVWWLTGASLVFYDYWNHRYLALLVGSILFNYLLSLALTKGDRRGLLAFGVTVNLAAIGYYKYAGFLGGIFVETAELPAFIQNVALPLAISFFTFQQIAYLIDVHRGKVQVEGIGLYALFVSFFPQLIAGPIVRYQEVGEQLKGIARPDGNRLTLFGAGVSLFIIGLAKKVLLADTFAYFATHGFAAAQKGEVGFVDAWIGALAYTFQLYFDFSGYSDMALGLGLMMGIRLPINFYSPYKADSVVDFWRRWHITLSHFFRDYLYFSIGGSRVGHYREVINLLAVMGLVGLWHGAGWSFILWGLYHGAALAGNHALRWKGITPAGLPGGRLVGVATTFLLVVIGWVLFRSESLGYALGMYKGMGFVNGLWGGLHALADPRLYLAGSLLIVVGAVIVLAFPNSMQLIAKLYDGHDKETAALDRPSVAPVALSFSPASAVLLGLIAYLAVTTLSAVSTEFLYYNF